MSRSLLLVAALVVTPSLATAGSSKAWNAAKKVHVDAPVLAGVDVASAKNSESFKKFFPMLLEKKPEAKDGLARLQKECGFDPFVAVNSVVAVIDNAGGDNKGAFFIALNGWDAAKLGACAQKLAKSENKEFKIGPIKKGIQEIEMVKPGATESKKGYLGWIGKDVIVIATDPSDRAFVESMLAGKGAGAASKLARKLDTAATVWMSVMKTQSIQKGVEMKAVYGTVKVANGNFAADARVVVGDKQQATDLVAAFNKELPNVSGSLPPAAQGLMKTLKVQSTGPEVQATANAPEKEVLDLLMMLSAFL